MAKEAGIWGGPSQLDISSWPSSACLNWLYMGRCKKYDYCKNEHPESVDEATVHAVLK
jgi:hypothetical protein